MRISKFKIFLIILIILLSTTTLLYLNSIYYYDIIKVFILFIGYDIVNVAIIVSLIYHETFYNK